MKNKKLSHNGLQGSVTSVMAALLCILIGLFVGFLVLLAINPAHAWADGFVRILKGGFHDAPYGVGKELANAAPLIMTGLSVGFAFKTGLFNIGAAGQYTLGAYGALYRALPVPGKCAHYIDFIGNAASFPACFDSDTTLHGTDNQHHEPRRYGDSHRIIGRRRHRRCGKRV